MDPMHRPINKDFNKLYGFKNYGDINLVPAKNSFYYVLKEKQGVFPICDLQKFLYLWLGAINL